MRLANKIALITGSARGIGEATARLFAKEGATVILTDINDELGQSVASDIGGACEYLHLDVSDPNQWQQIQEYVLAKYEQLDVLVNNAGITGFLETDGPHDPENLDFASWKKVNATNTDGVVLGCQSAIKMMKHAPATSIVNISSRSGIVGIPGAAAYAASKAAIRNHTKTVALYCAQQGYAIRCNSIHPGAILTPMWDAILGEGDAREAAIAAVAADVPLGVMGKPEDVAFAALFLASDEASYITGIELNIDGGILAGSAAAPSPKD